MSQRHGPPDTMNLGTRTAIRCMLLRGEVMVPRAVWDGAPAVRPAPRSEA